MSVENLFLTVWAWACLTIAIMAVAAAFGRLARKQIAAVFTASLLAMIIGIILCHRFLLLVGRQCNCLLQKACTTPSSIYKAEK